MSTEDLERRLAAVEGRLAEVERQLAPQLIWPGSPATAPARAPAPVQAAPRAAGPRGPSPGVPSPGMHPTAASALAANPARRGAMPPARVAPRGTGSLATSVLGWGGAAAFVLAAAYLIRLGIDSGWLTPSIQIGAAVAAGIVLIGAGFGVRDLNARYAGYLPACGIAILFLAIYGAQLLYGLVGARTAVLAIALVCALSLWLCREFSSDLYALFAVAGSYSAPLLLARSHGSITDLAIYFSAWSVIFSVYAIRYGRRLIYLLAAYLALLVFDLVWQLDASGAWVSALVFQTVQFGIFGAATALFSTRREAPLDTLGALLHLPPLLIFYALQYHVLDQHLPALAPWISIASVVAVALLYFAARRALQRPLPGGELLLWGYLAVVLLHAGYLEAWPGAWAPWASFILVPAAALVSRLRKGPLGPVWALWAAVGAIFALNYVRVIADFGLDQVPGHAALAIAYAALLYAGYGLAAGREGWREMRLPMVYAGHFSAMAAAVHLFSVPIIQSTGWGLLALACLVASLWRHDRGLAQSSLLVFGATAGKVLIFDLSGAQPIARILSLVVLGGTFYVGGLFYQRLAADRPDAASRGV